MTAQPDHDQITSAMLEVRNMYVGYYKDLHILQGVNLVARQAKITAVLGANGVGKSTLVNGVLFPALMRAGKEGIASGASVPAVGCSRSLPKSGLIGFGGALRAYAWAR